MMKIISFLTILLLSDSAYSAMEVYPMEVGVGKSGVAEITLTSKSPEVQFIRLTAKEIINPGTDKEKEITADMSGEGSLTVTPQKIALTAGGSRVVRLIALQAPQRETTWRVYVEGVSENQFSNTEKNSASVGVNIVWGVLVHVAPATPVVELKYDPAVNMITNGGTLQAQITEIGNCRSENECSWKKYRANVYPDTTVKINPSWVNSGSKYKVRYHNWVKGENEEQILKVY